MFADYAESLVFFFYTREQRGFLRLKGGEVFVSFESDNHEVTIEVRDTGMGIKEEEQVHIFNKFFRTANAKKKESVGSGLGLFAVKSIVERHEGKIWFESTMGSGSTFFIALPIVRS